ncbi:MAG TPA: hypothetical protein V6D11_26410 [Waterburya sp.]|jgi:hypothetical protein
MIFADSNIRANYSLTHHYALTATHETGEQDNSNNESVVLSRYSEPSRSVIAALEGYDVTVHGFGFENYGEEKDYVHLTSAEVERMFGEQVCVSKINGECILTPLGEKWMQQKNQSMGKGHCDGMAALSLLFYVNHINVKDFGGISVNSLRIEGNEKLQREIAYWWTTQATEPTQSARDKNALTPQEVVQELVKAFKAGFNSELYTIALWNSNGKGGHAVTPFAVEEWDNNVYAILVYDNNYPNITRKIIVDSNANTWKYNASINPNAPEYLYEGDANTKTLLLTPTSSRLRIQQCPFCEEDSAPLVDKVEAATSDLRQGTSIAKTVDIASQIVSP